MHPLPSSSSGPAKFRHAGRVLKRSRVEDLFGSRAVPAAQRKKLELLRFTANWAQVPPARSFRKWRARWLAAWFELGLAVRRDAARRMAKAA